MLTTPATPADTRIVTTSRMIGLILGLAILVCSPSLLVNAFFIEAIIGSALLLAMADRQNQATKKACLLDVAFWLPTAFLASTVVLWLLIPLSPRTIDSSLDFGVARHVMHWAGNHPMWNLLFTLIYDFLPVAMAAAIGSGKRPWQAVRAFVIAAVLAVPLYVAFPAVGPREIYDSTAPRNCMPFLHLTWALLAACYGSRRLRPAFLLFAVLTAISTLTTGEHYLLDLIAAIPFTWLCIWVEGPYPQPENHTNVQKTSKI